MVLRYFENCFGQALTNKDEFPVQVKMTVLHQPNAEVQLFSPQTYFKEHNYDLSYMDHLGTFFETGLPNEAAIYIDYESNDNRPMVVEDMYFQQNQQEDTFFPSINNSSVDCISISVTEVIHATIHWFEETHVQYPVCALAKYTASSIRQHHEY